MITTRQFALGTLAASVMLAGQASAAEITDKSVADFILDSAYQAAEQTILDQNLFIGSESQFQEFLELLDRPAQDNPWLRDLFSRPVPWDG